MKFLNLAKAALLLGSVTFLVSACSPNVTTEACIILDPETYIAESATESGMMGPNRAGVSAFNERIFVPGFKDRRKSMFAFKVKSTVPRLRAMENMKCTNEKLICEDPSENHCQSFTCKGTVPAGVYINIIDTPVSEFYQTTEPTYMEWSDGVLKCGSTQ